MLLPFISPVCGFISVQFTLKRLINNYFFVVFEGRGQINMQYGKGGKLNAVTGLLLLSQTPCGSCSFPAELRSLEYSRTEVRVLHARDGDCHPATH